MSTVMEMVVTNPVERNIDDENIQRYLDLVEAGDLPAFRAEMLNHTLNVSSPEVLHGRTALHMAALHGKLEIAKLIMGSPEVSVQVVNAKDFFGYTPLHLAVCRLLRHELPAPCIRRCVDLVRLLAESPLTTLDVAATREKDDKGKDCDGWTPLHLAASVGNVCIVKILLQNYSNGQGKPINIHATNWQGESALDIAKRSNHDSRFVEILECFDRNWLQLERQKSANSINAILVGATVVATVTITTLMQPPMTALPAHENSLTGGGTAADQLPVHWFNQPEHSIGALIIVNSFSFSVSVLSFIVGINGLISSTKTLKKEVHLLRTSVRWASRLLFTAILCLVWAMFFGSMPTFHVVVPHRNTATKILSGATMVGMPIFLTLVTIISVIISWVRHVLNSLGKKKKKKKSS